MDTELRAAIDAWRADDPDPATVAALDAMVAAADEAALEAAFAAPLAFGTAGLRGPLGPGPGRMNRAVVRRAAAGLCRWLDDQGWEGPVVVARDARHGSADFARDTAAVVAGAGRSVVLADRPLPTPLLAFAVRHLGGAAGVMVTASHNPPADNGYKVYAGDGAQIVAPWDREIAAHMAAIERVSDLPLAPLDDARIAELGDDVVDAYVEGVAGLRTSHAPVDLRVAYTPMHGVGLEVLQAAFARAGLAPPAVVEAQAHPDPDFPTVAFPNPEEPGAMDLLLASAEEHGADLAIANDPDADRLALAVPGPRGGATTWRVLTGDEIGLLLADHLLRHSEGADRLLVTTVVSSSALAALAAHHDVQFVETLTGFKWLARAAMARPDLRPVLGYEEALGYSVGSLVRDKDGISAAVVAVEAVAGLLAERSSVAQRLAELAVDLGLHRTRQRSLRFEGLDGAPRMAAAVDRIRTDPPEVLGGFDVVGVEDLALGQRLPPTDGVVLRGDGMRVVVRPSGTEPKLKLYVEVVRLVDAVDDVGAETDIADERIDAVLADLEARLA
ncbi:phospho-sugar mutase [Acidimicrobiia bacterium EGI L10123]|uniref:phospho-sugar mutase n=1 Tax=Salinilacustrithrix flava TaxID=2957203 RepID=UPI003D7C204D|nr:phospho-sugar mutase [Acidimicrobiia bacterium EGI L10123]